MLASTRQDRIKHIIFDEKKVSVTALAELLDVSEETIRRDLRVLEEEGILIRKYGGAVLADRVTRQTSNRELREVFAESKELIANTALPLVKNGDCLFIDSSTTNLYLCRKLIETNLNLTVITNAVAIMSLVAEAPSIRLIGIGGNFDQVSQSFCGPNAEASLSTYYADKAFLSCRSLSLTEGASDSDASVAHIKSLAIARSQTAFLTVDHSKLGSISLVHVCDLTDIAAVITDREPSDEWTRWCADHAVKLYSPERPATDDEA